MWGLLKKMSGCYFCKEKDDDLEYVRSYGGMYGQAGMYMAYHEKCLLLVCDEPEEHSNNMIDRAIEIIANIKYWKEKRQNMIKRLNYNCKYLKENCIGKQNE